MSANTPQDEGAFERNLIYKSYTNKINWLGCWKHTEACLYYGENTPLLCGSSYSENPNDNDMRDVRKCKIGVLINKARTPPAVILRRESF